MDKYDRMRVIDFAKKEIDQCLALSPILNSRDLMWKVLEKIKFDEAHTYWQIALLIERLLFSVSWFLFSSILS
jgi:O6-methylguanine-DNA--protein-cysteine methyltransferase